jgi:hypothetical protein
MNGLFRTAAILDLRQTVLQLNASHTPLLPKSAAAIL